MSEDAGAIAPEIPVSPETAPEAVETASTESASASEESKPEVKTFTQEDVDAITAKRVARTERKFARELEALRAEISRVRPVEQPQVTPKPAPDQFKTTEEYVEALAAFKAEEIVSKKLTDVQKQAQAHEQAQKAQAVAQTFAERQEAARERYVDFDEVAFNPSLPITDAMAETIRESELGCELAYYLGKNPAEAQRIAKLSPFVQAKELGRLETKLSDAPVKKPSAAPAPIKPVTAKDTGPVVDLNSADALKKYGTSGLIERWNQEAIRRAQQR